MEWYPDGELQGFLEGLVRFQMLSQTNCQPSQKGGEVKKIENIELHRLSFKENRMDRGDITGLANNIRTYGLQFPLIVTDAKGKVKGKYDIVDGRRRFHALLAIAKGKKEVVVPCIVLTKEEANKDLSLILNTHRLDHNPVELFNMAAKYVKDELKGDPLSLPPERIKDVAVKLNLDIHATCRILNIGRLDEDVRDLVSSKKLSLKLALITLRIPSKTERKRFCNKCIKERPSINEALNYLKWDFRNASNRNLDNTCFDVLGKCVTCRYRGFRDQSLFDNSSFPKSKIDEEKDFCWNASCYDKKEKEAWQEAFKEAKEKLGLVGIKKFRDYIDGIHFKEVKAIDPEQCKKCKQVKLTDHGMYGGGIFVVCPVSCTNIKQTESARRQKQKVTKKDPKDFTDGDKESVLVERFGLAARKAMIEHFFIKPSREFIKGKEPKSFKRILFFVGFDARKNPFLFDTYDITRDYVSKKEEKKVKKIITDLDLKKVAKYNVETAADHLYKYDVANTTPEEIDEAIALLYGIKGWCKLHYDEIKEKLSKRSKQFLVDIKPWKPNWA